MTSLHSTLPHHGSGYWGAINGKPLPSRILKEKVIPATSQMMWAKIGCNYNPVQKISKRNQIYVSNLVEESAVIIFEPVSSFLPSRANRPSYYPQNNLHSKIEDEILEGRPRPEMATANDKYSTLKSCKVHFPSFNIHQMLLHTHLATPSQPVSNNIYK